MISNNKIINIGHGNPTIFRAWWDKYHILPTIQTKNYELYEYCEDDFSELINLTHEFHQLFNTDSPSSSIVYGNGSTQVIHAILYALSSKLNNSKKLSSRLNNSRNLNIPLVVGYEPPVYMLMHEFLTKSKWIEVTFDLTRTDIDVEIVIDPNNPSGERRRHKSSALYVIYDRAYHWPIYTDVEPISDEKNHITVYTISKLLGMGGLRLGWAFINDINLTKEIQNALLVIGICPNSFSMHIIKNIFVQFITHPSLYNNYIDDISAKISKRRKLISYCDEFIVTNDSGPYAWIRSKDGGDISKILLDEYQIKVYSGTDFASTSDYARLSLICSKDEFNQAIERLFS